MVVFSIARVSLFTSIPNKLFGPSSMFSRLRHARAPAKALHPPGRILSTLAAESRSTQSESTPLTARTIVDFIADIFHRKGSDSYLGENVTMSEHMLQGAHLAEQAGASDAIVAGALLHDIGHYTNEFPKDALAKGTDNLHEEAGAHVLAGLFPRAVTDCIRWHVAAKRYLCATDPDYFGKLSPASVHTLNLQGGPMDAAEVKGFTANPNLDAILQVRIWDDQAKVPGLKTPDFAHYAPLLQRVVDAHCKAAQG